jgi:hypothetical protein
LHEHRDLGSPTVSRARSLGSLKGNVQLVEVHQVNGVSSVEMNYAIDEGGRQTSKQVGAPFVHRERKVPDPFCHEISLKHDVRARRFEQNLDIAQKSPVDGVDFKGDSCCDSSLLPLPFMSSRIPFGFKLNHDSQESQQSAEQGDEAIRRKPTLPFQSPAPEFKQLEGNKEGSQECDDFPEMFDPRPRAHARAASTSRCGQTTVTAVSRILFVQGLDILLVHHDVA